MKIISNKFIVALFLSLLSSSAFADLNDADEMMMRATYKIQCGNSLGTCFMVLVPSTNWHGLNYAILVTAKHVLASTTGTNATIYLRPKNGNTFARKSFNVVLNSNGTNLWIGHPTADVAALCIPPSSSDAEFFQHSFPSLNDLADDNFIRERKVHPGDEVRVLGYPLGQESSLAGFPILRSGRIASYPLVPTDLIQTYLLDFRVFNGNSGGPAYMCERRTLVEGSLESVNVFKIMGLISQESLVTETTSGLEEDYVHRYNLGIGVMVPAQKITETIKLLNLK